MPRFQLRPSAEADLDDAFVYYEMRRLGLGLEFLTAVEATMARIRRAPRSFPIVYKDVRRALVRRFP